MILVQDNYNNLIALNTSGEKLWEKQRQKPSVKELPSKGDFSGRFGF